MSLRNPAQKMSKSDPDPSSRIDLDDDTDTIARKLRKAVTDSHDGITYDPVARAGVANLLSILAAVRGMDVEHVAEECSTLRMSEFKERVTESVVEHLRPIHQRIQELAADPAFVDGVLEEGAQFARAIAARKYADVWAVVSGLERSRREPHRDGR